MGLTLLRRWRAKTRGFPIPRNRVLEPAGAAAKETIQVDGGEVYRAAWLAARQEEICPHQREEKVDKRGGGEGRGSRGRAEVEVEKESHRGHSLRTESRSSVSRTREPIPVFALPSYHGWRPPLSRGVAVAIPLFPWPAWIFRALQIPPRASSGATVLFIGDRRRNGARPSATRSSSFDSTKLLVGR